MDTLTKLFLQIFLCAVSVKVDKWHSFHDSFHDKSVNIFFVEFPLYLTFLMLKLRVSFCPTFLMLKLSCCALGLHLYCCFKTGALHRLCVQPTRGPKTEMTWKLCHTLDRLHTERLHSARENRDTWDVFARRHLEIFRCDGEIFPVFWNQSKYMPTIYVSYILWYKMYNYVL